MKHKVVFIKDKIKSKYEELKNGNDFDRRLYKYITRALEEISQNPIIGVRIQKNLVPKEYKLYGAERLFKYDLPNGWRLIYTIANKDVEIYAIILEWFDHKNYEKRFRYLI